MEFISAYAAKVKKALLATWEHLSELDKADVKDIFNVLDQISANKKTASTRMNTTSSRAHTVFILQLEQSIMSPTKTGELKEVVRQSRMYLADLGGSEQLKSSGAQVNSERMRETVNINLGLLAVKRVVAALANNQEYVPYNVSEFVLLFTNENLLCCRLVNFMIG